MDSLFRARGLRDIIGSWELWKLGVNRFAFPEAAPILASHGNAGISSFAHPNNFQSVPIRTNNLML
jgi:hypothetical protein